MGRAGGALAGDVAEAGVGVSYGPQERICSGVLDCPSNLWGPGRSGLRFWTCPLGLLEACWGGGHRQAAPSPGHQGAPSRAARAPGCSAVGPLALPPSCQPPGEGPITLVFTPPPLALFPSPNPTRGSSPQQADGELGVRGEGSVRTGPGRLIKEGQRD